MKIVKDIVQWDVINWSKALSFWESHLNSKLDNLKSLELGSKNGGLALWLALKGSKVLCTDVSPLGNDAVLLHQKYGVSDSIEYSVIDALNIPFENEFDVIVFKSIMGGIGRDNNKSRQKQLIDEIYKALKKNGILLFAENLRSSPFHQFFRNKFTDWGKYWRYVTIPEIEEFLVQFENVELKTFGFTGSFGRTEKQRNFLGMADNFLEKAAPKSWHYIIAGTARK